MLFSKETLGLFSLFNNFKIISFKNKIIEINLLLCLDNYFFMLNKGDLIFQMPLRIYNNTNISIQTVKQKVCNNFIIFF